MFLPSLLGGSIMSRNVGKFPNPEQQQPCIHQFVAVSTRQQRPRMMEEAVGGRREAWAFIGPGRNSFLPVSSR
jgi:hypothetical protein